MSDSIESLLAGLAEPAAPSSLGPTVMARIAREADRETGDASVPIPDRRDRIAWGWAVVGLFIVLGLTVQGWIDTGALPDVTSSRIGFDRVVLMPVAGTSLLLLGLGLWLFLVGLFASVGRRKVQQR